MKMCEINWVVVQEKYNKDKISERKICVFFQISESMIYRAKKKGLFITRNKLELSEIIAEKSRKRTHSQETKDKISLARIKYLTENPDKVPYLLNHSSKESYPEKYFTEVFKKEGINVIKDFRIGLYELDFCILDKKINIEVDGSQHYLDKKIVESDIKRTKFLEENGWDVIRINWTRYQKLNYIDKEIYIKNLKSYVYRLIKTKPDIKNIKNKKSKSLCDCGLEKEIKSLMCIKCKGYKIRKVERPPYEQLMGEIKSTSYLAVGKKYGVSDNSIRKWIKNYKKQIL